MARTLGGSSGPAGNRCSDVGTPVFDAGSEAWLRGVKLALRTPEVFVIQAEQDLGGHELALLDFDPGLADRLRRIGSRIRMPPQPGVRSGLAISGSSAQGRVNPFPADYDFFERVHMEAAGREAAVTLLATMARANALDVAADPRFVLEEVRFGRASDGSFLSWAWEDLVTGKIAETFDGSVVAWSDVATDPGMVKLDWHLLDDSLGGPAKVTKVIDATWAAPGLPPESLDGLIDAEFQQVYLSAEGAQLAAEITAFGLAEAEIKRYAAFMAAEVRKHSNGIPPDHLKAAKRLYNLCRATGRFSEALWIRELLSSIAIGEGDASAAGGAVAARMIEESRIAALLEAIERDHPDVAAAARTE